MSCFRHCCLLLTKEIAWRLFLRSYCFLSKSTAHRKKSIRVLKLWNCYWKYYLRKIDMIWKRCYIVGIPSVILANSLNRPPCSSPALLASSFLWSYFYFLFFTLQRMLSLCEKNWGPKFIAVYYLLV